MKITPDLRSPLKCQTLVMIREKLLLSSERNELRKQTFLTESLFLKTNPVRHKVFLLFCICKGVNWFRILLKINIAYFSKRHYSIALPLLNGEYLFSVRKELNFFNMTMKNFMIQKVK